MSKKSPANRRLPPIDFATLKANVSIGQCLASYGWKPTRSRGSELRGPCPIHGSHSELSDCFSVSRSRNLFRCFKCHVGGDVIDLTSHLMGIDPQQRVRAAVELCRKLGIDVPRLTQNRPNAPTGSGQRKRPTKQ